MFETISVWFGEQLKTNPFFNGGIILMIVGALGAWGRRLPAQFYHWCMRRLFIDFEIQMKDEAFWVFNEWLSMNSYSKDRARWLSVRTQRSDDPQGLPKIILSPAPGVHWLWWKGRFMIVNRQRKENQGGGLASMMPEQESFVVSILTRKRATVRSMIEDAFISTRPPKEDPRMSVYTPYYGNEWGCRFKIRHRPLESIILRDHREQELIAVVEKFRNSEKWYIDRGIPHRTGMLFYGPPGNGKSSIAGSLAAHLGMDVAVLSLQESGLSDSTVRDLLADIPKNCLLLIEDIDCVFEERKGTDDKDNRVTFSGLLNALDGVIASEGRIIVMTTNHIDKLDPALVRPGRVDHKILFPNADRDQGQRLFKRFFPDATPEQEMKFGELVQDETYSMAVLQNHLLNYRLDIHDALEKEIVK